MNTVVQFPNIVVIHYMYDLCCTLTPPARLAVCGTTGQMKFELPFTEFLRGDLIVYADNVIRSLRLMVSARGSSEVSTDFVRQKDGPPQYQVVRETNWRPVLKVQLSFFCLRLCLSTDIC